MPDDFGSKLDRMIEASELKIAADKNAEQEEVRKQEELARRIPARWNEVKGIMNQLANAINTRSTALGFSVNIADQSSPTRYVLLVLFQASGFAPLPPWRLEVERSGLATISYSETFTQAFLTIDDRHYEMSLHKSVSDAYAALQSQKSARGA